MLTYDVLSPNPPSEQLMQWLYPEALSGGTTTPQQPAPVASFDVDPKEQPKNSSTQATDEPKLSTSSQQLGESTDNPDQPSYGTGI